MYIRHLALVALFAALAPACAGVATAANDDDDDTSAIRTTGEPATSAHYAVRRDLRTCPSPGCGGYFVRRVNRTETRCVDGVLQSECYVGSLDSSALGLSPTESVYFKAALGDGHVIVRGGIVSYDGGQYGDVGRLVTAEAWRAASDRVPTGMFYSVAATDKACAGAEPCFDIHESKLNSVLSADVSAVDLATVGADLALARLGSAPFAAPLIVAGTNQSESGKPASAAGSQLMASQFYTRVRAAQ